MELFENLNSSLLIRGDEYRAYRDPAVFYKDGIIHLWCTLVETEPGDSRPFMYVVHMSSSDLANWSKPEKLTVRDRARNFSSPGNIIEKDGGYIMCLQTYCRENGEKFGNDGCRLYTMKSNDLIHWSEPEQLFVLGNDAKYERMIDPYLFEKDRVWNCFFKMNGKVCRSVSDNLVNWHYAGETVGGENPCILSENGRYYLISSPHDGLDLSVSDDLENWRLLKNLRFGQAEWDWARGRLTAGAAIRLGNYQYMFFHGTGPLDERFIFDTHACIGVAWSRDLLDWEWK